MQTEIITNSKAIWDLDLHHSELSFKVRHLMISTVTGQLRDFKVIAITQNDDFSKLQQVTVTAELNSVDTNNEQRDQHLRSPDFFNAEQFSQLKFESEKYVGDKQAGQLYGNLTIKDVTKSIILQVEMGGIIKDGYGNIKAGFTVSGKINRKAFGLTWNALTETGGVVVADEVSIHAEIQLVKRP